jgi:hypothetical protein
MKGFIVTSIDKQGLRQSIGLESQIVRYTPVMADSQEAVIEQFEKAYAQHMIVLVMPIDVLKKNIEVVEKIAKQNDMMLN